MFKRQSSCQLVNNHAEWQARLSIIAWSVAMSLLCRDTCQAVEFVNLEHYRRPDGVYDVTHMPPELFRPGNEVMAKIGTQSGVMVAPNWILYTHHFTSVLPENYGNIRVNGVQYRLAQPAIWAPGNADLALLQIEEFNEPHSPANLPYVSVDPDIVVTPGMAVTLGGFGNHFPLDPETGEITGPLQVGGHLRWGRNVLTGLDFHNFVDEPDPPDGVEDIPFEALTHGNDSGGGWFVRDNWDWRLIGVFSTFGNGPSTIYPDTYNWITNTIGGELPALSYGSKPAATVDWTGPANGDWGAVSNWEDLTTPGVNHVLPGKLDFVSIAAVSGPTIDSGVSGEARGIFVGRATTDPGQVSKLSIVAGGQLNAIEMFVGTESGDFGRVDITGGTVSIENQYFGHRGRAIVNHTGGTNHADRIVVGYDNDDATASSEYIVTGASTSTGAPVVNAGAIIIGSQAESAGTFTMSGLTHATVNSHTTIVGSKGEGAFTQQKGTHNVVDSLVVGDHVGSEGSYFLSPSATLNTGQTVVGERGTGLFQHSGGTHSTEKLVVGANGEYTKGSGTLRADEIDVHGTFLSWGGIIESQKISGTLSLGFGAGQLKATAGLSDFGNASFINAGSSELIVEEDSLVLVQDVSQFGDVIQNGSLAPHEVGSTLTIGSGGFRAFGTISDHVELIDGGYAVAGRGAGKELHFMDGVTAVSGHSSLSADVVDSNVLSFHGDGVLVEGGANLAMGGGIFLSDATSRIDVEGELSFVPKSSTSRGRVDLWGSTPNQVVLDIDESASVEIVVEGKATTLFDRILLDGIANTVTANLDGLLSLDFDGYTPEPRDSLLLIINVGAIINGHFGEVQVDGSDAMIDSLGIGMAVIYGADVRLRASFPADFNLDDQCDAGDFAILQNNFNQSGKTWQTGDANGDGVCDIGDYSILQNYYNQGWPPAGGPVPEPASVVIASMALAMIRHLGRRRRPSYSP